MWKLPNSQKQGCLFNLNLPSLLRWNAVHGKQSVTLVPSAPAALWPAPAHAPGEQGSLPTSLVVGFLQLSYLFSLQSACPSSANSHVPCSTSVVSYELTSTLFFVWLCVGVFCCCSVLFPPFSIVFSPSFLSWDLQRCISLSTVFVSSIFLSYFSNTSVCCSLVASITLTDSFPFPSSSSHLSPF